MGIRYTVHPGLKKNIICLPPNKHEKPNGAFHIRDRRFRPHLGVDKVGPDFIRSGADGTQIQSFFLCVPCALCD